MNWEERKRDRKLPAPANESKLQSHEAAPYYTEDPFMQEVLESHIQPNDFSYRRPQESQYSSHSRGDSKQLQELKEKNVFLESQLHSTKLKLLHLERENEKLQQEVNESSYSRKSSILELEIQSLQSGLDIKGKQCESLEKALKTERSKFLCELNELKAKLKTLNERFSDKSKIVSSQSEFEALELREENKKLKSKVNLLQQELKESSEKYELELIDQENFYKKLLEEKEEARESLYLTQMTKKNETLDAKVRKAPEVNENFIDPFHKSAYEPLPASFAETHKPEPAKAKESKGVESSAKVSESKEILHKVNLGQVLKDHKQASEPVEVREDKEYKRINEEEEKRFNPSTKHKSILIKEPKTLSDLKDSPKVPEPKPDPRQNTRLVMADSFEDLSKLESSQETPKKSSEKKSQPSFPAYSQVKTPDKTPALFHEPEIRTSQQTNPELRELKEPKEPSGISGISAFFNEDRAGHKMPGKDLVNLFDQPAEFIELDDDKVSKLFDVPVDEEVYNNPISQFFSDDRNEENFDFGFKSDNRGIEDFDDQDKGYESNDQGDENLETFENNEKKENDENSQNIESFERFDKSKSSFPAPQQNVGFSDFEKYSSPSDFFSNIKPSGDYQTIPSSLFDF